MWFKVQTPVDLISDDVYVFKRDQCITTYLGETTRHLLNRVAEYEGV